MSNATTQPHAVAASSPVVMSKSKTPNTATYRGFLEANSKDVKRADVALKIPLNRIKVAPGFNPRDMAKPETQEKIRNLVESYKLGHYVKPIEVVPKGEYVEIVDGEGRYTAACIAHEELLLDGKPGIDHLVCVLVQDDEAKKLVMTVQGNEGEKLTPLEQSEVVKRLQSLGWNRERIAKELGFSIGWIDRLIVLMKMPSAAKTLVKEGKVAPDVASDYFKQHGDGTVAELKKLLDEKGGEKVTKKDVAAKKKAADKEPPPAKVKRDKTLELVPELANLLPDFGVKKSAIRMTEVYDVQLTGKTLKMLLALQEMWAEEEAEE